MLFCPRCGNKIPSATKVCPHCHYSDDQSNSNSQVIDVTPSKKEINKKPSYFFRYISFVLILCSLTTNILFYLFYGFSEDYLMIASTSLFIMIIGSYMMGKSLINTITLKRLSKVLMLIASLLLILSVIGFIIKFNTTICISICIGTIELIALSLVLYIMYLYVR